MKFVTLQMKPLYRPPAASAEQLRAFTESHSTQDCDLVDQLVTEELRRRRLYRARSGGPTYKAIEARLVLHLIENEVDLGEVRAQIEEARWEQSMDAAPQQTYRARYRRRRYQPTYHQPTYHERDYPMAIKNKKSVAQGNKTRPETKTYTPTKLFPQSGPRQFQGTMFRGESDKSDKKPPKKEDNQPTIHRMSDAALNRYVEKLTPREKDTLVRLIRAELVRTGLPETTRPGGTMWRKARCTIISYLSHYDSDLSDVRADMENNGMNLKDEMPLDGVIIEEEN